MSVYPPALGVTMHDHGNDYDGSPPLSPSEQATKPVVKPPSPATRNAIGWLLPRLQHGPARVHVLRKEGEAMSPPIGSKALYEARNMLGIEEFEEVPTGSTQPYVMWRLPANQDLNGQTEKVF
jgi:hypothetical protein